MKTEAEKIFEEKCHEVAVKHGLGKSLVTGHKAAYWTEAAMLAMAELKADKDKLKEIVLGAYKNHEELKSKADRLAKALEWALTDLDLLNEKFGQNERINVQIEQAKQPLTEYNQQNQ